MAKDNTFSVIKDKKIKVFRLGAIIGDNSKLVNVVISSGCKIWPNKKIKNENIKHDVL